MTLFLSILKIILAIKLVAVFITHVLSSNKTEMKIALDKLSKRLKLFLYISASISLSVAILFLLTLFFNNQLIIERIAAIISALLFIVSIPLHKKYREKPKTFANVILAAISITLLILI